VEPAGEIAPAPKELEVLDGKDHSTNQKGHHCGNRIYSAINRRSHDCIARSCDIGHPSGVGHSGHGICLGQEMAEKNKR